MPKVSVRPCNKPLIDEWLVAHPKVELLGTSTVDCLEFSLDGWNRILSWGGETPDLFGLPELMDNNPLVCADEAGVPDPLGTLGLIALGPLIRAGILIEPPSILTNVQGSGLGLELALKNEGWDRGADITEVESDLAGVCTAVVMALIERPSRIEDLDDLYEESYSRSFYVQCDEESEWDVELVSNKPQAVFRLRLSDERPAPLLTVQVMADQNGKCGEAQILHLFNIMCGFEETMAIPDKLRT